MGKPFDGTFVGGAIRDARIASHRSGQLTSFVEKVKLVTRTHADAAFIETQLDRSPRSFVRYFFERSNTKKTCSSSMIVFGLSCPQAVVYWAM